MRGCADAPDARRPPSPTPDERDDSRREPKLRLLVFSPYFPPHVGGLESYVGDLDRALIASGEVDEITVFAPWLPPSGPRCEDVARGYRIVRYPALELIPNFPVPKIWSSEFWRALRSTEPSRHDVFVSHTRFFLSSFFALAYARRRRRPLLHVEHGSDYVQLTGKAPRLAARVYDLLLGRLLLRNADAVVAVSYAAASFVRKLAGRDAAVIYRGVRRNGLDAQPPDAQLLEWAAARPIVVFSGRLIDGKGVADLLRAFACLHDVESVMCIVGDGPRRDELEMLSQELGIAARVLFLGYVSEQRSWSVMRASDVVVNPSYTEGLPTSVLEAAIMGKPVVATDVGGTAEIISNGRGGLLFKPRDVEALRSHLEQLLASADLREQLVRVGPDETMRRFDWNESARRFGEIASRLLERRRDHAGRAGAESITCSKSDS